MIPRKIIYTLVLISSVLLADENVINLKTFPRPTMHISPLKGEIELDGYVNESAWMATDSITDFYQSQPWNKKAFNLAFSSNFDRNS